MRDAASAARSTSPATAMTFMAENRRTRKSGNATAPCTAQPTTGAIGSATAAGTRRRVTAKPTQLQNSIAATAAMATFEVEAIMSGIQSSGISYQGSE